MDSLNNKKGTPVRLRDVAKVAEISVSAVSMALADHPKIGEKTKRRVRMLSRKLGYKRPHERMFLRMQNGRGKAALRFGFLLAGRNLRDEIYSRILHSLTESAVGEGLRMEVRAIEDTSDPALVATVTKSYAQELDGIVLCGLVDHVLLTEVEKLHIPCVMIGHFMADINERTTSTTRVVYNEIQRSRFATMHLIDGGHRRIAFICEHLLEGLSHSIWLSGYRLVHVDRGLELDPELIYEAGRWSKGYAGGNASAEAMLKLDTPPTAFIVPDIRLAADLIEAMKKHQTPINRDSIVIGGPLDLAQHLGIENYPLIGSDIEKMAAVAIDHLHRLCKNPTLPAVEISVPFLTHNMPKPPNVSANQRENPRGM